MKFKKAGVVLGAVALSTSLAACGSGSSNAGGETKCGDFLKMSSADQKAVVTKMLGSSSSNGKVTLTQLSAKAYCNTMGSNDSPISNINHG